jgi:hypothetical protein
MTPQTQESLEKIVNTLEAADNEGTESPYWLIIDPQPVIGRLVGIDEEGEPYEAELSAYTLKSLHEAIPNCITGPYFSRAEAEEHLKGRHYAFSKSAYVYCHSGYYARQYKNFCRTLNFKDTRDFRKAPDATSPTVP